MSFMFKGPAALTGSSTAVGLAATGAVSVGTTLGVTGTSTLAAVNASGTVAAAGAATVGTTLGVTGTSTLAAVNASGTVAAAGAVTVGTTLGVTGTSTLAAVNASGALTMGNNINIVVSGGGTISGLPAAAVNDSHAASKKYVDDSVLAASGGEGLVEPIASAISDVIAPLDTTGKNLYLIQAEAHVGTTTMTMDLNSGRSVSGGDTWTIVWASPQTVGTSTLGIKVDLGANRLYDANGTLNRYITLPNVGSSVRLVWHGSGVWHIIGGSGGIPSTS
jgi:hypothetical protein